MSKQESEPRFDFEKRDDGTWEVVLRIENEETVEINTSPRLPNKGVNKGERNKNRPDRIRGRGR